MDDLQQLMQVVIMAGGKGSRTSSIANGIPKPMISIQGKPVLEHQIDCLKRNGLTDITLVIGHLGNVIMDYFADGSRFGCKISYYAESEPLGTGGALYKMANLPNDFVLLNGDVVFNIEFSKMIAFHRENNAWATLAVHPNSHPYDSALIITDHGNKITGWLNKEDKRLFYKNQVNAGIHIVSRNLLKNCHHDKEKVDLDRDILKPSIFSGKIFAYKTPEYIKDMGTPERYVQVSNDLKAGIVQSRTLAVKQKAIFLDRDGTMNKINGFVKNPDDFQLIPGVSEAINKINTSGYLAIVVTNQPVIARGECSIEELDTIHLKMESDLGRDGAFIDDIFYCPHHPDGGFHGERPEYKIDCDCRKPKPGMIFDAAKKYNIDLESSYMVGDDMRDVYAGITAGCIPVLLTGDTEGDELIAKGKQVFRFSCLADFANLNNFHIFQAHKTYFNN